MIGRLGRSTRGAAKLAFRGLSRDRTRNAAVIGAAAVTLALPIVVLTQFANDTHRSELDQPTYASVRFSGGFDAHPGAERKVRNILGDDAVAVRLAFAPIESSASHPWDEALTLAVVDPTEAKRWFGDSTITDALQRGDAVSLLFPNSSPITNPATVLPDDPDLFRSGVSPKITTIRVPSDDAIKDPTFAPLEEQAYSGTLLLVSSQVLADGQLGQLQQTAEVLRKQPITAAEDTELHAVQKAEPTLARCAMQNQPGRSQRPRKIWC